MTTSTSTLSSGARLARGPLHTKERECDERGGRKQLIGDGGYTRDCARERAMLGVGGEGVGEGVRSRSVVSKILKKSLCNDVRKVTFRLDRGNIPRKPPTRSKSRAVRVSSP